MHVEGLPQVCFEYPRGLSAICGYHYGLVPDKNCREAIFELYEGDPDKAKEPWAAKLHVWIHGSIKNPHFETALVMRGDSHPSEPLANSMAMPIDEGPLVDSTSTPMDAEKYLAAMDTILLGDPTNCMAWNDRGMILQRLHRYDEALTALNQAIRLDPSYSVAWLNRAATKAVLGNRHAAIDDLRMAISLDKRARETARDDPDFEGLQTMPEFQFLMQ
jgi:tetratricopeptide (TPR) repeat protein